MLLLAELGWQRAVIVGVVAGKCGIWSPLLLVRVVSIEISGVPLVLQSLGIDSFYHLLYLHLLLVRVLLGLGFPMQLALLKVL